MDRFRTLTQLPLYVHRAGETVFAAPYVLEGTGMDLFVVKVVPSDLNLLINGELNQAWRNVFGSRGVRHVFEMDGDEIGFAFTAAPKLMNVADKERAVREAEEAGLVQPIGDENVGAPFAAQLELIVLVPIVDSADGRSYWYLPYVLNDFPLAVAAGREVFGYPKQFARFHSDLDSSMVLSERFAYKPDAQPLPFGNPNPSWSTIEVHAYDLAPKDVRVQLQPVITLEKRVAPDLSVAGLTTEVPTDREGPRVGLTQIDVLVTPPREPKPPTADSINASGQAGAQGTSAGPTFLKRLKSDSQFLFLKEFRDPARGKGPDRACYQGAVLARVTPTNAPPDDMGAPDGWHVTLHPTQMLNLPASLFGGSSDTDATRPVDSRASLQQVDFNVSSGELWWEA